MSPIKDRDHLELYHGLKMLIYVFFALYRSMNRLVWSFGALETCAIRRFREVGAVDGEKLGQDGLDEEEEEGKGEV